MLRASLIARQMRVADGLVGVDSERERAHVAHQARAQVVDHQQGRAGDGVEAGGVEQHADDCDQQVRAGQARRDPELLAVRLADDARRAGRGRGRLLTSTPSMRSLIGHGWSVIRSELSIARTVPCSDAAPELAHVPEDADVHALNGRGLGRRRQRGARVEPAAHHDHQYARSV